MAHLILMRFPATTSLPHHGCGSLLWTDPTKVFYQKLVKLTSLCSFYSYDYAEKTKRTCFQNSLVRIRKSTRDQLPSSVTSITCFQQFN